MKNILTVISLCLLLLSLGCGKNPSSTKADVSKKIQHPIANASVAIPAGNTSALKNTKVLIAYFTWADNTQVANPQSVNVDASTSASVLAPGNVAKIAGWIQTRTGGDIFSIITVNPYDSDYSKCLARANQERKADARPALTKKVSNLDKYDTVFLGYPNLYSSVPQAMYTFIQENNLEGKKIIPFCGHGTGGLGSSIVDLKQHLPQNVTMEKAIGVYRPDTDKSRPDIEAWLTALGY